MTTSPLTMPDQSPTPSAGAWLRATWFGWVLGVPCIAALALAAELAHLGGLQVFVGAGMGLGVGLLQARLLRRLGIPATSWILASAVGLAVPFLIWDIAQAYGTSWSYYLAVCVAAGGVVVGTWQALLLRGRLQGPVWWILGSLIGWGLAGLLATSADLLSKGHALRGISGAAIYLGLVTLPGGVLGLVTARVLTARWRVTGGPG